VTELTLAMVIGALFYSGAARACDGKTSDGKPCPPVTDGGDSVRPDPSRCATQAELIGPENCAWTTTMMAQRVLDDGAPWTYVGRLVPSSVVLTSKVAVPYTVGPDAAIFVIANEVLDSLARSGASRSRIQITGKVLEVEGIVYFVPTLVTPTSS
jgi:hypothetical protein